MARFLLFGALLLCDLPAVEACSALWGLNFGLMAVDGAALAPAVGCVVAQLRWRCSGANFAAEVAAYLKNDFVGACLVAVDRGALAAAAAAVQAQGAGAGFL